MDIDRDCEPFEPGSCTESTAAKGCAAGLSCSFIKPDYRPIGLRCCCTSSLLPQYTFVVGE